MATILKTYRSPYLNCLTDFDEIWYSYAYYLPTWERPLKFQTSENPKWQRWATILKITKIAISQQWINLSSQNMADDAECVS